MIDEKEAKILVDFYQFGIGLFLLLFVVLAFAYFSFPFYATVVGSILQIAILLLFVYLVLKVFRYVKEVAKYN